MLTDLSDLGALQALRLAMHLSAAFLNNSSSRWEAIWDAWEFKAELVDHVSPIYRSDFLRCAPPYLLSASINAAGLVEFALWPSLGTFTNAVA